MATKWFGATLAKIAANSATGLDWVNAQTWKAFLLDDGLTTNSDSHRQYDFFDDVSGASMSGCTAVTIPATAAVSHVSGDTAVYYDCGSSVQFTGVSTGQTCQGVVIYRDSGTPATSEVLCFLEFSGGSFTTNGQAITINFNTNGVAKITY